MFGTESVVIIILFQTSLLPTILIECKKITLQTYTGSSFPHVPGQYLSVRHSLCDLGWNWGLLVLLLLLMCTSLQHSIEWC